MHKNLLIIGALGFSATPAFTAAAAPEPVRFQTIVVQGGQGSPITLRVRTTPLPEFQRFAFTGETIDLGPRIVRMRFGQGDLVAVPVPTQD